MSINNSFNNSIQTNNNTSFSSESKVKKIRKDAKGNLILKKEKKKLKSKFHVHLVDNLYPGKELAHVIEVESFKKYNLESEEKTETKQRCCNIF